MAKDNAGEAAKKAAAAKVAAEAKAKAEAEAKAKADQAAADAKATGKTVKVPALSVASKQEGFRRGGRAWSKEATVVKLSELSKEQIAQIKGESMLTVAVIEIDEEIAE